MVSRPIVFMVPQTRLLLFPNKNSSLDSTQKTDVLTSASEVSGHACRAHSQRALCFFFVGSEAEPKVNSWSEATLPQLFQDWLSVTWTTAFPVSFKTMDFVFCKSGVLLFFASLGHCVLLKFGLQDTLSYRVIKKCAALLLCQYSFRTPAFIFSYK